MSAPETRGIAGCHELLLPRFDDPRGSLSFIEGSRHVPFDIQRVYYLYGVPFDAERGGHGHRALAQVFLALNGSFDLLLDDGHAQASVHLDRPERGYYVCPMMWREVKHFTPNTVCLVLASTPYDEADYFRRYEDYLAAVRGA
jgi:hypothetical protein